MIHVMDVGLLGVSNLRFTGITTTSAVLLATGDETGGTAQWTAVPRNGGATIAGTTVNAYTAAFIANGLEPNVIYDVQAVLGGVTLNGNFTTKALTVVIQSGIDVPRRRAW